MSPDCVTAKERPVSGSIATLEKGTCNLYKGGQTISRPRAGYATFTLYEGTIVTTASSGIALLTFCNGLDVSLTMVGLTDTVSAPPPLELAGAVTTNCIF